MLFEEALAYLLSLGHETLTIKLGLRNTERLLAALGNPQKQFPSVQIAGTNGKGSTAVMLESICRQAGVRTGLFTSPHLIRITERIRINSEEISPSSFARFTNEVKTTAEKLLAQGELETLPTFFEHVTAIALLAFREARIELAILETGLGGRLDSTTAAGAEIVGITQIAIDHEEYLGQTLPEIAAEKAAIIRPGVAAVVAPQSDQARGVIQRRAEQVGVTPVFANDPGYPQVASSAPQADRMCVSFMTGFEKYEDVCLGVRGRHQIENATTAIALAEALRTRGVAISREAVVTGLEEARHPGRLEIWDGEPPILFDGAHNPAAAKALRAYLDEFVNSPVTMIFGAMRDKALSEMAATLFAAAHILILTEIDNPRAARIELLESVAPRELDRAKVHLAQSPEQALQLAKELTVSPGLICVTGSLYLVGRTQEILKAAAHDLATQAG
jgi:dihydrofolate synthase / folylpolyglutamate synthase